jgi:hypothetical protein
MATLSVGGTTIFDGSALQSGVTGTIGTGVTFPTGHILQVVHNYIDDTHTSTDTDFVWDDTYTNVVAKGTNSSYVLMFDGNYTAEGGTNEGDSILGFGFAVDPAGGTTWTDFGGGTNTGYETNRKFFSSRLDNTGSNSFDGFYLNSFNGQGKYTSSVAAGVTLRFGIRYFGYGTFNYTINTNISGPSGSAKYYGNSATAITILEVAA